MFNHNDELLPIISMENTGPPVREPSDLESVFDAAVELVDGPDVSDAIETHGEIVLACVFALLADKLARYGVAEEKRIAIACQGRDRKFERADELFKILSSPTS
jgi:hypothetical protein